MQLRTSAIVASCMLVSAITILTVYCFVYGLENYRETGSVHYCWHNFNTTCIYTEFLHALPTLMLSAILIYTQR